MRMPQSHQSRRSDTPRIGVDLGGTKIEVIALAHDGSVIARQRKPTPAGNYAAILDTVAALVAAVESVTGPVGRVGVGTPGAISSSTGLIKNSNSAALNGQPLDRDLARRLGREVRLENDANCLALSEAVDGAAAGASVVFAAIIGTGVGGGIAVHGTLLRGRNEVGGEWGHNPLPWMSARDRAAILCYCGKSGCIETYLSGAGLVRTYHDATDDDATGEQLTALEIAHAARSGEERARACLALYADQLARSLATVINVLDPDVIVLGGGLSNISDLYSTVPPLLGQYAFSDCISTPVLRALHGDSSGVRGAAWLW